MFTSQSTRARIRRVPVLGAVFATAVHAARRTTFPGSADYWETRYAAGGTSGGGSTGELARFKADTVNGLVASHGVDSVVEFGCGDGAQLRLAEYPRYLGLDVSPTALRRTMRLFRNDPTKSFMRYDPFGFTDPAGLLTADLALSLDVVYHLVEDDIYQRHLAHLFGAARRLVVLYTSDAENLTMVERTSSHVRHRPVQRDIALCQPHWRLLERIPNREPYRGSDTGTSFADFLVYERRDA